MEKAYSLQQEDDRDLDILWSGYLHNNKNQSKVGIEIKVFKQDKEI